MLQLLVSLPVGGAEDLVAAILRGLDPARFEVQAAVIGPLGVVGEELTREGYPIHRLGVDIKRTPDFKVVLQVRRLLRHLQPDILHTHLYHPNYYGRLAAWGLGLKGVVASVHNVYARHKFHRRFWNFLLSRLTDQILAVSPQVWRDVRCYDRVPPSRLRLLPNGISLAALELPENRAEARARLGVAGLCLGAVGRLEEQKGHAYLLQALPLVLREVGEVTLLVAGDGRLREALERQAGELGVAGQVKFLGTRRDMPLIYRALDVLALPSLWEGLPLALLEAMGAGLPVVASSVGGVPEVIQDKVNGRLTPPGDVPALVAAIVELARRPEQRAALGKAARETVREHYSRQAMLRKLTDLYEELYEQGRKREKVGNNFFSLLRPTGKTDRLNARF